VLREHYASGGAEACLPLLPGRSLDAIYKHAFAMGLTAPATEFRRERWQSSEAIDNVIRRYWLNPRKGFRTECARVIGRPGWWTSRRATHLGLTAPRFKEPAWSEDEIELVGANGHKSLAAIQKLLRRHGFVRTETAIVVKLKRMGPGSRIDPEHYTAGQLAKLMGVNPKTVTRWIATGMLKADRRGTERSAVQGGDHHWIHRKAVRSFVRDNAAAVDLRKVDRFWFIDLAFGGPG
jgi:hypothetical protein